MIKKNTKMIFEDGNMVDELIGGLPLSEGEIIHVKKNSEIADYKVTKKSIDFIFEGEDQNAEIIYWLKKE